MSHDRRPSIAPALLGALVLGLAACQGSTSLHASARLSSPRCRPGALGLALSESFSPMTGEHGRLFVLRDRSQTPCTLDGSPRVGLYEHGRRMPFVYRYPAGHGGELYVSGQPPRRVLLRPGSVAYFLLAKYRCDGGADGEASELQILLPGGTGSMQITLPAGGGGFGVSALDHCRAHPGDQRVDPGNRIEVSAITASRNAAFGFANANP